MADKFSHMVSNPQMALGTAVEINKSTNPVFNKMLPARTPELEKKKPDSAQMSAKQKIFPSFYHLIEIIAPYVELSREEAVYSFDKCLEVCTVQGSTVTCYYLVPNKYEVLYGDMAGNIYRLNLDTKKITQEHKSNTMDPQGQPIRILAQTRNDTLICFVQNDCAQMKEIGKPTQQPQTKLPLEGRKIWLNAEEKIIYLSDQVNEYLKYSINDDGKEYVHLGKLEVTSDARACSNIITIEEFLGGKDGEHTLSLDAMTRLLQSQTSEIIAMRATNKDLVVLKLEGTRYYIYKFNVDRNQYEHTIEVQSSACLEKTVYRCLAVPRDSRNEEFIAVGGNTWDILEDGICSLGMIHILRSNVENNAYQDYATSVVRPFKFPNQTLQKIDFLPRLSNAQWNHMLIVFDKSLSLVRFKEKKFQVVGKSDFQMNPEYSYIINHSKNEILTTNCNNKFVVIYLQGHK